MAALQYVDVPGYAALLVRRTFPQLTQPKSLIPRSHEWLAGTDAEWNEQKKRWTFPSGAVLQFGHLDTEKAKHDYQSAEFQFIGFDELTQFTETQYRYLLSRLRRLQGFPVPLRVRSASNPGGTGHDWVRARFIDAGPKQGRPFVRSRLEDNLYLDREEYADTLAELDPITRAQLKDGDWTVRERGGLFLREWFRIVEAAPADAKRVRSWDFAATVAENSKDPDWTIGARVAIAEGVYYVEDVRRLRGSPAQVEALVSQTAALDGRGIEQWLEVEGGSAGKHVLDTYQRRILPGYPVGGEHPTGPKAERWRPLASAAEAGNVRLVRGPWITDVLDSLEATGLPGAHDDDADALAAAVKRLTEQPGAPIVRTPRPEDLPVRRSSVFGRERSGGVWRR